MNDEPNRAGGWTGTCPVPGCGVWLQGASEAVVGLHLEWVHRGDRFVGRSPVPPRPRGRRRGAA